MKANSPSYVFEYVNAFSKKHPNLPAVLTSGYKYTYLELSSKIDQITAELYLNNLRTERIVAVALDKSFDLIATCLAVLKAGGVFLPIDVSQPKSRLSCIIEDSKPSLLITKTDFLNNLPSKNNSWKTKIICLDKLEKSSTEVLIAQNKSLKTTNAAYVIYTSGSTGEPKGVVVEHRSLMNLITFQISAFKMTALDRIYQFSACTFDAFIWEVCAAFCVGASIYIPSFDEIIPGIPLVNSILKSKCTILTLTPSILDFIKETFFPDLRVIISAGEPCYKNTIARFSKYDVYNAYGPTECTVCATIKKVDFENLDSVVPIGVPIEGTEFYIRDFERGTYSKTNIEGELCIAGNNVAREYLNKREITKSSFIIPFSNSDLKIYKTGDLVRLDSNGELVFLGRIDEQIKRNGFRIEPREIEKCLECHEDIDKAVVMLHPLDKKLSAFIVVKDKNERLSASALRCYLKNSLPEFMVPHSFYEVDRIPISNHGKRALVDFKNCKTLEESTIHEVSDCIENKLIKIFLSHLQQNHLSLNEDFFACGLESISLAEIISQISEKIDATVTISDIFECPTIYLLGEKIKNKLANKINNIDFIKKLELLKKKLPMLERDYRNEDSNNVVLLLGATGFLGSYILKELLLNTNSTIYCLVRGENSGHEKIKHKSEQYGVTIFDYELSERVKIITGDISKERLGLFDCDYKLLSNEVDRIIHAAGDTSFIKPFSSIYDVNVNSLLECILMSAEGRRKKIEYVSTLAVFSCRHYFEGNKIYEENSSTIESAKYLNYDTGYIQTKWLADSLAQHAIEMGYLLTIHRPGYILCNSKNGMTNQSQKWSLIVKGCYGVQSYPSLKKQYENFVLVDDVANAITRLSLSTDSIGRVVHYSPQKGDLISTIEFFEKVSMLRNLEFKQLEYRLWVKEITNDFENNATPLLPLLSKLAYKELFLPELYQETPVFSNKFSNELLEKVGIQLKTITDEIINKYISSLETECYEKKMLMSLQLNEL